jgi:hypothetical protein
MSKYKLNFSRDVDTDEPGVLILNLPSGFRFYDDLVHTRGYESMAELKEAVRDDIIPCDCKQCQKELEAK